VFTPTLLAEPDDGLFRVAEPVPFGQPSPRGYGSSPLGGGPPGRPGSHRAVQRRETAVSIAIEEPGRTRNCIAWSASFKRLLRLQRLGSPCGETGRSTRAAGPTGHLGSLIDPEREHGSLARRPSPKEFVDQSTPRGVAPTPRPGFPAGVPIRLLSGVDAVTGRARFLAERIVDRLALFAPRGPLPPACSQCGIADPRAPLPERPGVVVTMMKRKLSKCAADCSSPLGEETLDLPSRQGSYPISLLVSTPIF